MLYIRQANHIKTDYIKNDALISSIEDIHVDTTRKIVIYNEKTKQHNVLDFSSTFAVTTKESFIVSSRNYWKYTVEQYNLNNVQLSDTPITFYADENNTKFIRDYIKIDIPLADSSLMYRIAVGRGKISNDVVKPPNLTIYGVNSFILGSFIFQNQPMKTASFLMQKSSNTYVTNEKIWTSESKVLFGAKSIDNKEAEMQCFIMNKVEWDAIYKTNTSRCEMGYIAFVHVYWLENNPKPFAQYISSMNLVTNISLETTYNTGGRSNKWISTGKKIKLVNNKYQCVYTNSAFKKNDLRIKKYVNQTRIVSGQVETYRIATFIKIPKTLFQTITNTK